MTDDAQSRIARRIAEAPLADEVEATDSPSSVSLREPPSPASREKDSRAKKTAKARVAEERPSPMPSADASADAQAPKKSSRTGGSGGRSSGGVGGAPPKGIPAFDVMDERCSRLPLTDLGNAERFCLRNEGRFLFCDKLGWLAWDGKRWAREGAVAKREAAEQETVRSIQREASAFKESGEDFIVREPKNGDPVWYSDQIKGWGRASESKNHIQAISTLAACRLEVRTEALDADPMRFNVQNGTLVFQKRDAGDYVQLRPHDPGDLITKIAPVAYDPKAECPLFDGFMDEVQPPDEKGVRDKQRFLHQWGGLSLTGVTGEQKLTFHWGKGRNGKGVWVQTLAHIAGDYADSIAIESFLDSGRARAGGQATPDLAKLPGVRFLMTSEPERNAKLAEGLVKLFTGEDMIDARHLNKDFFKFRPQAKLTMQGNYRPRISGTDEGIWGRIILVPWLVFIPPEKRDKHLAKKLQLEGSGILNRLLDGLRDWMDSGLALPESVVAATQKYRADSDPLGRFLEACTRFKVGARVQSSEMHRLFCAWAKANGEPEWTPQGLGRALRERGIPDKKSDVVWWLDIELTHGVTDFGLPPASPESDSERY